MVKITSYFLKKLTCISDKFMVNYFLRCSIAWRDVRVGRRSTIGNRVGGYNRLVGSNPTLSAIKPKAE